MFNDPTIVGSWPTFAHRLDSTDVLLRWGSVEPALAGLSTTGQVHEACSESSDHALSDAVLGALVRLAAVDGGRDDDALTLVLHLLSGMVWSTVRQLKDLSPDIVAIVVGELACQIRKYPWQRRPRSVAANLRADTRHAVLHELLPRDRRHPERGSFLTSDGDVTRLMTAQHTDTGGEVDLQDLLQWALRSGVDATEIGLLIATEYERDLSNGGGDSRVAAAFGISTRTLYRRRNRTLAALRAVADDYLAAVA